MVHGMPSSEDTCPSTAAVAPPTASAAVPADDGLPRKRILSQAHLKAFKESETYKDIVGFVEELNSAIVGKKLSENREESPVRHILLSLSRIDQLSQEGCKGCSSHLGHPRRGGEGRTGDTSGR
jgi:serine/threonine-protein phosphatase 2A activator